MLYVAQFNYWTEQPHEDIYDDDGDLISLNGPLASWIRKVYSNKSDAEFFCGNDEPAEAFIVEIVKTPKTKKEWIKFINSRTWEYCEMMLFIRAAHFFHHQWPDLLIHDERAEIGYVLPF